MRTRALGNAAQASGLLCCLLLLADVSFSSAAQNDGLLSQNTDCGPHRACQHSIYSSTGEQAADGELENQPAEFQAARRALRVAPVFKTNPYGVRYTIGERALTLTDGQEHLNRQQRRQERRKSIQRKNKYGGTQPLEFTQKAFEPLSSDEPTLKLSAGDRISSTDELADKLSTADSTAATRSKSAAAAFDSTALEDHVASDFVHEQDVQVQEVEDEGGDDEEEIIVPKHAQAGEGQLGIGGTEKAGGVDSSGVSEHIHDHPTVLSAGTTANGTKLDATGAQMPKQARAAGVDSSAMSGHMAEDVGEELLVTSGSMDSLAASNDDASDREVVQSSSTGGTTLDGATFNQQAIREAADDVLARPGSDEEVDISAVGLMPADWAASPEEPATKGRSNSSGRSGQ